MRTYTPLTAVSGTSAINMHICISCVQLCVYNICFSWHGVFALETYKHVSGSDELTIAASTTHTYVIRTSISDVLQMKRICAHARGIGNHAVALTQVQIRMRLPGAENICIKFFKTGRLQTAGCRTRDMAMIAVQVCAHPDEKKICCAAFVFIQLRLRLNEHGPGLCLGLHDTVQEGPQKI